MEKREPSGTSDGDVNWLQSLKNSMEVPQKIKNKTTIHSSNSLLGIYPKKTKTVIQKGICAPMFAAALIAKSWKQPKCTHQQMNK